MKNKTATMNKRIKKNKKNNHAHLQMKTHVKAGVKTILLTVPDNGADFGYHYA